MVFHFAELITHDNTAKFKIQIIGRKKLKICIKSVSLEISKFDFKEKINIKTNGIQFSIINIFF